MLSGKTAVQASAVFSAIFGTWFTGSHNMFSATFTVTKFTPMCL